MRSVLAVLLVGLGCGGTAGDLFDTDAGLSPGGGQSSLAGAGQGGSDGPGNEPGSDPGRGRAGAGSTSQGGAGSGPAGAAAGPGIGAGGAGSGTSSAGGAAGEGAAGEGSGGPGSGGPGSGGAGSGGAGSGDPGSGNAGAGSSGAGPGNEGCDPCPCSVGPFGEPELVAGLASIAGSDSFGPAPSADGLTLFFSSEDLQEDIFFATRTTRENRFGGAQLVPGINDPLAADGTPFISADDRALYFFSTRPDPDAPGDRDIWVATRAAAGEPFSAPELVPGVNTPELEHLPRLSPDGLALMFVSGRDTLSLSSNIWQATRATPSAGFSVPSELPGVNSDSRDEGFWLSADGLTVFFASNRAVASNMDIWVAERGALGEPFGEPQSLSVVNTPGIEIDPALTLDGFELFFASDRSGSMQLYRSARVCD